MMMEKQKKKIARIKKMLVGGLFFTALAASLVAEKFIQIHPVAGIDGRMFFHAWFGFISCIIFILFSKILGFFLKRQENYYKEKTND